MKILSLLTSRAALGALIIASCIVFLALALTQKKRSDCGEDNVKLAFKSYRLSLYEDDLSAVIDHFHGEFIRTELVSILESDEFIVHNNMHLSKESFAFGDSVVELFKAEASCNRDECDYDLLYGETKNSDVLKRLVVSYKCTVDNKPLIYHLTYYFGGYENERGALKPIDTFYSKLSEKLWRPKIDPLLETNLIPDQ